MIYKTVVIDYAPKAKKMAAALEEKINELTETGWEFVTFSITNSAKAIVVFRVPDPLEAAAAPEASAETAEAEAPEASAETAEAVEVIGDAE